MARVKNTFAAGQRVYAEGQEVPDGDPIVEAHPLRFYLFADVQSSPKSGKRTRGTDAERHNSESA